MIRTNLSMHRSYSTCYPTHLQKSWYKGNRKIGRFTLALCGDVVKVFNVLIFDENHRGKGYGQAMMNELVEYVKSTIPSCKTIWLDTTNPIARHIYKKVGFVVIKGRDFGYYRTEMELKICQS